jgi:hypothetical protein
MEIQTIEQDDRALELEMEAEARIRKPLPQNDSADDVYHQLQQMPVLSLGGRNFGRACRALRAKRRRH